MRQRCPSVMRRRCSRHPLIAWRRVVGGARGGGRRRTGVSQLFGLGSWSVPGSPRALNRPGFGGGGDDTEGSLSWDSRKYPDELRERATRTGVGGAGRSGAGQGCDPQDSARSWVSTPRLCAPGSRRPRSTRAPGPAPPPTRHSGSRSWRKRSESCEEPTRSQRARQLVYRGGV